MQLKGKPMMQAGALPKHVLKSVIDKELLGKATCDFANLPNCIGHSMHAPFKLLISTVCIFNSTVVFVGSNIRTQSGRFYRPK